MPEPNTRMAVIGRKKAHLDYIKVGTGRDEAQKAIRELVRELEKTHRDMRRKLRKLRRARGG